MVGCISEQKAAITFTKKMDELTLFLFMELKK